MDSLTQIVLGASVGEAVCGKRAGNKALLWGAVAGTIPDLDVLANPFQDLVQQLTFHRSLTHSLLFAILISPVFGLIPKRLHTKSQASYKDWTLLFFLGLITHALLDCFTTWGTKVFYPFSDYAVSFQNIFVIDPLYTLPFIICVGMVFFYDRKDPRRRYWNDAGLLLSSAYLLVTLLNKHVANDIFQESLEAQQIDYSRFSSRPTPLNSLLWSATAETEEGYYIGYYSLLDEEQEVSFSFFPKNHQLLSPYVSDEKLQELLQMTEGYYIVDQQQDTLLVKDLRFGQLDGWGEAREDFTFVYQVVPENGQLTFSQKPNNIKKARELMGALWQRIMGNKEV